MNNLIIVKAKLILLKTEDGGRSHGIKSGYRPNHVFEYINGSVVSTYIGDLLFEDQEIMLPGEEKNVTVRFLNAGSIENFIVTGRKWFIHEGARLVGKAEILTILDK